MIKLVQAINQMNPGDYFKPEKRELLIMDDGNVIKHATTGILISCCPENLELEGEIIRAEPNVLTAEQIVKQHRMHRDFRDVLSDGALITLSENSIKNGQIKEWKRLKPLRDVVNEYLETGSADFVSPIKNLTPPWESEQ